jgi:amidase
MPLTPPTVGDLASIAQHYGLHLEPDDLESFRVLAARLLASYDHVERLYGASLPDPPQRPYQWPAESANDWAPGTSPPRSPPAGTGPWPAAGWRSRTTSPSPGSR